MFIQDYVPEEYSKVFDCSDGEHSVVIGAARVAQSKNGNQMLEVALKVDDIPQWYIERYVAGEYFNRNITRFFDAFNIQRGNFNFDAWKGARARAVFEHRESEYTDSYGNTRVTNKATLKYFVFGGAAQNVSVNTPADTMAAMGMSTAAALPTAKHVARPAPARAANDGFVDTTKGVNSDGFVEDIPF